MTSLERWRQSVHADLDELLRHPRNYKPRTVEQLQSEIIQGARILSASVDEEAEARLDKLVAANVSKAPARKLEHPPLAPPENVPNLSNPNGNNERTNK